MWMKFVENWFTFRAPADRVWRPRWLLAVAPASCGLMCGCSRGGTGSCRRQVRPSRPTGHPRSRSSASRAPAPAHQGARPRPRPLEPPHARSPSSTSRATACADPVLRPPPAVAPSTGLIRDRSGRERELAPSTGTTRDRSGRRRAAGAHIGVRGEDEGPHRTPPLAPTTTPTTGRHRWHLPRHPPLGGTPGTHDGAAPLAPTFRQHRWHSRRTPSAHTPAGMAKAPQSKRLRGLPWSQVLSRAEAR